MNFSTKPPSMSEYAMEKKKQETEPMQFITLVGKKYDKKTDIWWGYFTTIDDKGNVDFKIPINEYDFDICVNYRITFKKYEKI